MSVYHPYCLLVGIVDGRLAPLIKAISSGDARRFTSGDIPSGVGAKLVCESNALLDMGDGDHGYIGAATTPAKRHHQALYGCICFSSAPAAAGAISKWGKALKILQPSGRS